MRLMSHLMSR